MTKTELIKHIQEIAAQLDGSAPGMQRFESETGIKKSVWYPDIWLRWSDALSDAGFAPNKLSTASDAESVLTKYIEFVRELGRLPVDGEIVLKRKSDQEFPSHNAFRRFKTKRNLVQKALNFCESAEGYDDIIELCQSYLSSAPNRAVEEEAENNRVGYVYLIQHGSRKEYKIGMTLNPIRREGELRIELPEKVKPIHYIETDDPYGIESYWHARFSKKRKEGEWFSLSNADIRAFKRWKKIY